MNADWLVVFFFLVSPITVALLGYAALLQFLRHREWMLYVSKGLVAPAGASLRRVSDPLRWAVILLFAGIGIALSLWPVGLANPQAPYGLTPWMLLGATPISISLALLIIHVIDGRGNRAG